MNKSAIVKGRCYYAQSNAKHPYVWSVYDNAGKYIESFGGSVHAARERVNTLDFEEIIHRRYSRKQGGMKGDRASQPPGVSATDECRARRVI